MNIREAKKEDLNQIREIYNKYYIDEPTGLIEHEDVDHFTKKVEDFTDKNEYSRERQYQYFVAEDESGKILGFIGSRTPHPTKLLPLTKTNNPIELYTFFVLEKNKGVGKKLLDGMISFLTERMYTEIIVFSHYRWKESWPFYDKTGFERITTVEEPNQRLSQIWTMKLKN